MQLDIIAIGRLKADFMLGLYNFYVERFNKSGRSLGFALGRKLEFNESQKASSEQRCLEEGEKILASIPDKAFLIVLDERGKHFTSPSLAHFLQKKQASGISHMVFALGGADGHADLLIKRADLLLSLSSFTFPHQLARIILLEQLYRSMTILSNHPYHRA